MKRKKLSGGIQKEDNHIHFILIGQLGKHIDMESESGIYGETSAVELLDDAFDIIYQVKERITCTCVLVECKDKLKLRKLYEDYGFKELQRNGELIQYFKIL